MSSADAGTWQAIYFWNGHQWKPLRGVFSGLRCADCRATPGVLYRKGGPRDTDDCNYYCEEHKP